LGARHARGEILAYTDDDCTVPPDWLRTIADAFRADERIGMVFGNILAGPHDRDRGFVQAYVRKSSFTATKATQKHLVEGIGACMAIRRDVWEAVGGFDLALGAGGRFRSAEDTDLSLRVLLAGFHVHETPVISVEHHGFRTWEQRPAMFRNYLYGLGAMTGKHLRLGNWQVLNLMLAYAFRWSVTGPVVELGPRPPRLLRLQAYASGILSGALARSHRREGVFETFSEFSGHPPPD
jgi:GT2 family glycosyltransferase